jgi:hypothetical protein
VVTFSGEVKPIKWIGRRAYRQPFVGDSKDVVPILFKAGALGEGLPRRDLYVSPNHAMFIDDVLIPAGLLVNGVSVLRCPEVDQVRYFHVELASHDVIFSEGVPAETFVDCDCRGMFHNAAEFSKLYPADDSPAWAFCAPRVEGGVTLRRVWRDIAARAGLHDVSSGTQGGASLEGSLDRADRGVLWGWARTPEQPNLPVELEVLDGDGVVAHIVADGYHEWLAKAGIGDGHHHFRLNFNPPLSPWRSHVIRVRRAGDKKELANSPVFIGAKTGIGLLQDEQFAAAVKAALQDAPSEEALEGVLQVILSEAERMRRIQARRRGCVPPDRDAKLTAAGAHSRPDDAKLLCWAPATRASAQPRRRRALVIDERLPTPGQDAGSNAVLGHTLALIRLGYEVEFAAAREMDAEPAEGRFGALDVVCHRSPATSSVEDVLQASRNDYDLVYLHRLGNAAAYAGLVRVWCPRARVLYSVADLHHLRLARQAAV